MKDVPKNKANLMIIGASGGVANAVLHYMVHHRNFFGKLVLVDKNKGVLSDPCINHKELDYIFIHKRIKLPEKEKEYHNLLKKYRIDIVLDVTDDNTIPLIEATDRAGVSCINTGVNDEKSTIPASVMFLYSIRGKFNHAPHIACSGMNPGVVSMWARHGIERFGIPDEFVEFEYDTSKIARKWSPMMTWSIHEFIDEVVDEPSGVMLGKDKFKELLPSPIEHRVDMKNILAPILKLDEYPHGFTVTHEEMTSLAQKYNIPAKYIYAVNMKTMKLLISLYEKCGGVSRSAMVQGDNTNRIMEGSDSIGLILNYGNRKVYYFNTIPNIAVIGTSATYLQVAVGVFSAIFTLLFDRLKDGLYFPEDLYGSHYKYYLFDNMRVQEFVFAKKKGEWKLESYNPEIKLKRRHHLEHMYI